MNTISKIIIAVLSIALIISIVLIITAVSVNSKLMNRNTEIHDSLVMCQNAPVQIDTVYGTITIASNDTIRPKPKHYSCLKPKPYADTTHLQQPIQPCDTTDAIKDTWYKESWIKILSKDTLTIKWSAHVWGEIDWLVFDSITYPTKYIRITKTVPVISHEYTPKNHWGMYGGAGIKDFKSFPSVRTGLWGSFKDKWGIRLGPAYEPDTKQWRGEVGIDIFFK